MADNRRTKFYLNRQDRKWKGVCAGIADYTGIEVLWVRIAMILLTLAGGFPWTLVAYWLIGWMAEDKPANLYGSPEDAKFWQGVRTNPKRTTAEVRSKFRELDRRLADIETHYTSRNTQLADEIERLR
ncbi:envelope stress response membrane protein PspC [Sphingomonas mucosissima]|uniref:Phage shock protein C n=1 Tax=Sphingomonas mucosissima TaxID=370959 RepID=A0A245ZRA5_9SPHN|nr:envelope stress response membrane protein PspC [Sphingomonas mucosissima]OWK32259.1 phage shock protein C [Sphingomonas mucosissima]